MTPDLLRQVGEAIHGEHWRNALSRDLGVSDRTVRRWLSGREVPAPGIGPELLRLLDGHLQELATTQAVLAQARAALAEYLRE